MDSWLEAKCGRDGQLRHLLPQMQSKTTLIILKQLLNLCLKELLINKTFMPGRDSGNSHMQPLINNFDNAEYIGTGQMAQNPKRRTDTKHNNQIYKQTKSILWHQNSHTFTRNQAKAKCASVQCKNEG